MSLRLLLLMAATPVGIILTFASPFAGAVFLILIYFLRPEVWDSPAALSPSLVVTGVMLVTLMMGRIRFRLPSGILWPALLLACMVSSSFAALISPDASFEKTTLMAKSMVVWLLLVLVGNSVRRLYILLWSAAGGVLWLIKSAIYYHITTGQARVSNVGGQGSDSNYLSVMLLLTFPLLLFEGLESRSKLRWLARALMPLWLWGLILTGSRGGLIGFGVLIGLYLLQSAKKGTATVLALFLAGFLFVAGSEVYWSRMRTIATYEEDESARSRLEIWKGVWDLAQKYPLTGVGLANFVLVSPMYTTTRAREGGGLEAHNTYLQLLAEGGIPMLVVFLSMLLGTFRKLSRIGRDPPGTSEEGPSLWRLRAAILTGLAAYLTQSLFGTNYALDPFWWYLAFAEALTWVAARQAESLQTAPLRPGSILEAARGARTSR